MSILNATKQFDAALADAETNLTDAKQSVIHWEGQVLKLTQLKDAMKSILSPEDFAAAPPKTASRGTPAKSGAKPKAAAKGVEIPATSHDFWMGCLTAEPQKTADILNVAVAKLKIEGEDKIAVLRNRQTAFLQKQAAEGNIKSEGERANRTYSLNPA